MYKCLFCWLCNWNMLDDFEQTSISAPVPLDGMIGQVVKRRQLVGVMSARPGWTVSAMWFTPHLAFWPSDAGEYQSDLFDFSFWSSSSPQLLSRLSDRPSSHSSASTHVKGVSWNVSLVSFFPFLPHAYCLLLEHCQFTGTVHDGVWI